MHMNLRNSQPDDEVRNVAQARTMSILPRLDATRVSYVISFLREAGLIKSPQGVVNFGQVNLPQVDWTGTDLSKVDLSGANLRGARLTRANLREAKLCNTLFWGAGLSGADLSGAVRRESRVSHCSIGKGAKSGTCCSTSSILEWRSGKVTIRQKPIDKALQPAGWQWNREGTLQSVSITTEQGLG